MIRLTCALLLLTTAVAGSGCQRGRYNPSKATQPYPDQLHSNESVDIQVFRNDQKITLYNATANSYHDFDVWINQRYVTHVDALPAGGRVKLSLWDFWDERGEVIDAGGIFRVYEPTPVRLVQIQMSETEPLIGLITIRDNDDFRQRGN
ncbi:MAG: hypothetical protein ACR2GY_02860 [Phycisphaerales bacterium]